MFGGLENRLAQAVFGIPAVKGIAFGDGFEAAERKGSENNDAYGLSDGKVVPLSNHAGGILGGLSTGAPVVFRVAFKPTPSIAKEQDSVDLDTLEPVKLAVKGRHDPCVVLRAVPCVEAAAAIAVLDAMLVGRFV
jgi:chorismate synthase